MQGVFIVRAIVGWNELANIVKSHAGLVFLQQEERAEFSDFLNPPKYVKLMTKTQKENYLKEERLRKMLMSTGFPLALPRAEPIVVLETLKAGNIDTASAASREWLVDRFNCAIRPKSKKELTAQVKERPADVYLEATSQFGNEYSGSLAEAPHQSFSVVGPDPAKKRSWYAQIYWSEAKGWVVQ